MVIKPKFKLNIDALGKYSNEDLREYLKYLHAKVKDLQTQNKALERDLRFYFSLSEEYKDKYHELSRSWGMDQW